MTITSEKINQGQELLKTIIQEAWENTSFKNDLISNPIETIESFTGNKFSINSATSLVVEDQMNADTIYLNIPRKTNINDFELSDEQLEMISGGEFVTAGVAIGLMSLFAAGVGIGIALKR